MQLGDPIQLFELEEGLFESPLYLNELNVLLFVSIDANLLFVIYLERNEVRAIPTSSKCSWIGRGATPFSIWLADTNGLWEVELQREQLKLIEPVILKNGMRFNDAIVDSTGNLIIGTKSKGETTKGESSLYCRSAEHGFEVIANGLSIPNGMVLIEENVLLMADSFQHIVYAAEWDGQNRSIGKFTPYLNFPQHVYPDGICKIDENLIAVAEWGNGCISFFDVKHKLKIDQVNVPNSLASNVTYSKERGCLFITAASQLNGKKESARVYEVKLQR